MDSKSNNSSTTPNPRKRAFSEMNGDENTNSSFLSTMYFDFDRKQNQQMLSEQVMSAQDFSLQNFGEYTQMYSHSNKCQVCCISFCNDGSLNAIGCIDGSIRIFDVNKLHQSSNSLIKKYDSNSYSDVHRPIISSLNSGFSTSTTRINEIDFYPNLGVAQHLVSCIDGGAIYFYEFGKNRKSPISSIGENFALKSVQYHPMGHYVIAGGESCYVRLYDIKKEQGYIAKDNDKNDYNIECIRWSMNGHIFASCNNGGSIRLYDGRSMEVINTMNGVHKSMPITSIQFSKCCKYLLSAGRDNFVRLIDLRVGKECQNYKNFKNNDVENNNNKEELWNKNEACFSFNDEHIVTYSNMSNRIFVYDTNSGQRIAKFKEHTAGDSGNRISYLATSPTEAAFMCASTNDNKNRFYATNKQIPQYANEEQSNSASQSVE